MSYSSALIQQVNAPVSYPDLLGLYLGLTRFVGEENVSFLQRLYRASNAIKDTSVIGLIDTISLNLNLDINQAISIESDSNYSLVLFPGVLLLNNNNIPLFTMAADTYMEWLQLSDVVATINQISGFTASLLISDRPALTLCKQTNLNIQMSESITTTDLSYTVNNSGLLPDTIIFSFTPPAFTINNNTLFFEKTPTSGLTISYQYITSPYTIISSDVNLVGLGESNLIAAATNSSNILGYQLREAIQNIMRVDSSYWAN